MLAFPFHNAFSFQLGQGSLVLRRLWGIDYISSSYFGGGLWLLGGVIVMAVGDSGEPGLGYRCLCVSPQYGLFGTGEAT